MNIIIPIGGIGQRFKNEGFVNPKPLINIHGKPMIFRVIENLDIGKDDTINIIYNPELNNYLFEDILRREFSNLNLNFLSLEGSTRGAAETVLFGLDMLNNLNLEEEFLLIDCDTIYQENIVKKYKESRNKNSIFFFRDDHESPIFSYIDFDESRKVSKIAEKNKISNNANSGAYGFESGHILRKYCSKILSEKSELYISMVYSEMILDGIDVYGIEIKEFDCVGTPLQLKVYCEKYTPIKKVRVCFDLDNTLVTFPKTMGDYSTVEPIKRNIEYLKFLKKSGSYIIIYTARRMRTFEGNLGKVIPDISEKTIETLRKFNIPYDELHFGKPWADFYIDDLAVKASSQLDKEIGFYNTSIKPRSFNQIYYNSDSVKKESNNEGEIYWYSNIPLWIKKHLPEIYSIRNNSITMERIRGVNYSYLYTNQALRESNIDDLVDVIKKIHTSDNIKNCNDMYLNYSAKLISRYESNIDTYNTIGNSPELFREILDRLSKYEKDDRGRAGLIHGDPVFTNIFLTERTIKFIDPRGKLGENLSLYGDVNYDFSKILQSIMGYDHILNGSEINYPYVDRMTEHFLSNFNSDEAKDIKNIAASLFFTLIPLHDFSEHRFKKYFNIIEKLLK